MCKDWDGGESAIVQGVEVISREKDERLNTGRRLPGQPVVTIIVLISRPNNMKDGGFAHPLLKTRYASKQLEWNIHITRYNTITNE